MIYIKDNSTRLKLLDPWDFSAYNASKLSYPYGRTASTFLGPWLDTHRGCCSEGEHCEVHSRRMGPTRL